MKTELIAIKEIKLNPNNPRLIKDAQFKKLVNSIKKFPKMLSIRPIVVNDDCIVLGGNMRLRACIEAGLKEIPIIKASDLSSEEQKEFMIKDNASFGEWDWDILANEWDTDILKDWGVNFPDILDYSDKNKEIDTNSFADEMIIKLKYSEEDYHIVKEKLSTIAQTPEQAVWKLLEM